MSSNDEVEGLPALLKSTASGRKCLSELEKLTSFDSLGEQPLRDTLEKIKSDEQWTGRVKEQVVSLCRPYCKEVLLVTAASPSSLQGSASDVTASKSHSEGAKNIHVLVVVAARDCDAFDMSSTALNLFRSSHVEPWLQVYDVARFLDEVMRCNVRILEALMGWDRVEVCRHELLATLRGQMEWREFCCRDLFNRSSGQLEVSLAAVRKQTKNVVASEASDGGKDLSPAAEGETKYLFGKHCLERRLLAYMQCSVSRKHPLEQLKETEEEALSADNIQETVQRLKAESQHGKELNKQVSENVRSLCMDMLEAIRLEGLQVVAWQDAPESQLATARSLLSPHGGAIAAIPPSRLLFLSITGSKLYRLNVASSDEDFLGVYARTPQEVARDYKLVQRKTVLDNRGKKLESGDVAIYEAAKFTDAIIAGGVEVIQMLFTDDLLFESELFKQLKAHRMKLLSEKVITNYCGYVEKHFDFLKKPQKTPSKVFYHIYHKLGELERLCRGEGPKVQLDGEERDYILRIRREPMEGELSYENLLRQAHEKFDDVRERLKSRTVFFPSVSNTDILNAWLLDVYGLPRHIMKTSAGHVEGDSHEAEAALS